MHTFTFTWCHVMDTSSFGTEQCFPLPAPVGCFQLHPWTDVHVAHRATRRIKKQISADFSQKLIACSRVLGHDSRASRILGLVDPFIAHRFAFAKLKLETCNLKLITSQSSQVNLVLHHIHHIIKYPIFQKKQNYVLRVIPTATVKPCLVPTARSASRVRFDANIWIFEGFGKKKQYRGRPSSAMSMFYPLRFGTFRLAHCFHRILFLIIRRIPPWEPTCQLINTKGAKAESTLFTNVGCMMWCIIMPSTTPRKAKAQRLFICSVQSQIHSFWHSIQHSIWHSYCSKYFDMLSGIVSGTYIFWLFRRTYQHIFWF